MSGSSRPKLSLTGEVDAPPAEVLKTLVRSLEKSGLGKVTVDEAKRRVSLEGQWWYRGGYSVEERDGRSLIVYRVFNIASGATRWLVPLVERGSTDRLKSEFQQLLKVVGKSLHAGARYNGE